MSDQIEVSSSSRPAEFAFIDWIRRQAPGRPEVRVGIGDDAAVLNSTGREWVTTVDVLTAGVHFTEETPLELVGRKALAVNLSDLAAMAAEPCAAFIGIVLPRSMPGENAERLYKGIFNLAAEWNVSVAGGDTNSWDGPLVISLTLMGLVEPGKAIQRNGARPGDWIFVTGALGGSLPSQRHLTFAPRVSEALELARGAEIHSMLDISDGLGSDLFHILQQSGVGAKIDGHSIPIHPDVPATLPPEERLKRALSDGEDFELLFTVAPETGKQLLATNPLPIQLTKIGEITLNPNVRLLWDGTDRPFPRSGWSHKIEGNHEIE